MADTQHTLEIITKIRDLASAELRKVGQAGQDVGRQVEASTDKATGGLSIFGAAADRHIGKTAKGAFASLAVGISTAASSAQDLEHNLLPIAANLAGAFAAGGPWGLAIAGTGILLGQLFSSGSKDAEQLKQQVDQLTDKYREQLETVMDTANNYQIYVNALKAGADPDVAQSELARNNRLSEYDRQLAEVSKKLEEVNAKIKDYDTAEYSIENARMNLGFGHSDAYNSLLADRTKLEGSKTNIENTKSFANNAPSQEQVARNEQIKRSLEEQYSIALRHTALDRLQVQLDIQRAQIAKKSQYDAEVLAQFDELAAVKKQNLQTEIWRQQTAQLKLLHAENDKERLAAERDIAIKNAQGDKGAESQARFVYSAKLRNLEQAQDEALKNQLDSINALSERDKIRAEYNAAIRAAHKDIKLEMAAEEVYAAKITNLERSQKDSMESMVRHALAKTEADQIEATYQDQITAAHGDQNLILQAEVQKQIALSKLYQRQQEAMESLERHAGALTDRQKAYADLQDKIVAAHGDEAEIRRAQLEYALQITKIQRDEEEIARQKKQAAEDYLQSLREETSILQDTTGHLKEKLDAVHKLAEAYKIAGQAGYDAEKKRQAAEKDAEVRGTTGQYVNGHMDKGLARARERRKKALHEAKYRKGFHNQFDEDGDEINQGGGMTLKTTADFNQIDDRQKTKQPGPPQIIATPPIQVPPEAAGDPGIAEAFKHAAEILKQSAENQKKEKEAADEAAKATGDFHTAVSENATAQEAANAAMREATKLAADLIIKNTKDIQDVKKTLDDIVNQLKAASAK